jgi:hypothetical protein
MPESSLPGAPLCNRFEFMLEAAGGFLSQTVPKDHQHQPKHDYERDRQVEDAPVTLEGSVSLALLFRGLSVARVGGRATDDPVEPSLRSLGKAQEPGRRPVVRSL